MSDVGTYDAIEDEILGLLTTPPIDGVAEVLKAVSASDLWNREAHRPKSIGVIDAGGEAAGDPQMIGSRYAGAISRWEVAVCVQNARGLALARREARLLLEAVRDRLHGAQTAHPTRARYLWQEDAYTEPGGPGDVTIGVARFTLRVGFGK